MNVCDKYKDSKPHDTIQKIRTILHDLDISTIDNFVESNVENCYSVRVNIAETDFGTNGKGVTKEYALASGYAEFMERLQSDFLYIGRYDKHTEKHCGFYHTPDETYATIDDLSKSSNPFVEYFSKRLIDENKANEKIFNFLNYGKDINNEGMDKKQAISLWKFLEPADFTEGDFVLIPYYDVKNEKIVNIPANLLRTIYGSNGICAGNTPNEAIVQGLSELFERYVNIKIIKDKLTPPDIPQDYLSENFPEVLKYKRKIEESGPYRIIFKDCSLGRNFPVAGIILIDYQNQTYKVKFGSHPSMAIALERSITELFQGFNLKDSASINQFSYKSIAISDSVNIQNIIKNASGIYPIELFLEKPSYEFSPFQEISGKDNKMFLNKLLNLLFDDGHDLYIRDLSYLGFPSFQLISLGLSEVYECNLLAMKERNTRKKAEFILNDLHNASDNELTTLSILMKYKLPAIFENTIPFLCRRPLKSKFFGNEYSVFFLLFLITYKLGKLDEAVEIIGNISNQQINPNNGLNHYQYYKCIKDFIEARIHAIDIKEMKTILAKFYNCDIVNKVASEFGSPEDVLKIFYKKTNCFNCESCGLNDSCHYEKIKKLNLKLKEKARATVIDQFENKKIFSDLEIDGVKK